MKKILVLASRFPYPPIGGEKLRLFHIIRFLSRDFEVELCALYASDKEIAFADGMSRYCRRLHLIRLPRIKRLWNSLLGIVKRRPLQVSYYFDASVAERIDGIIVRGGYDGILVHLVRMMEYCRNLPPSRILLEMTDAISMNYSRIRIPKSPRELIYLIERARLLRYELAMPMRTLASIVVSETDKAYLESKGSPGGRIHVIKNGTSMEKGAAADFDCHSIAFIGNMRSMQNEDMCLFFAGEIFPLIARRLPKARFTILGANPSARIRRLHDGARILVRGEVADIAAEMVSACLTVCPMRYGAGIQNKILESMALGVPVVTTGIGLEGIGAEPGREVLVADTPSRFAEAALRLMMDPAFRNGMSRLAEAFIDREFRWESRIGPYLKLVGGMVGETIHETARPLGLSAST